MAKELGRKARDMTRRDARRIKAAIIGAAIRRDPRPPVTTRKGK